MGHRRWDMAAQQACPYLALMVDALLFMMAPRAGHLPGGTGEGGLRSETFSLVACAPPSKIKTKMKTVKNLILSSA